MKPPCADWSKSSSFLKYCTYRPACCASGKNGYLGFLRIGPIFRAIKWTHLWSSLRAFSNFLANSHQLPWYHMIKRILMHLETWGNCLLLEFFWSSLHRAQLYLIKTTWWDSKSAQKKQHYLSRKGCARFSDMITSSQFFIWVSVYCVMITPLFNMHKGTHGHRQERST